MDIPANKLEWTSVKEQQPEDDEVVLGLYVSGAMLPVYKSKDVWCSRSQGPFVRYAPPMYYIKIPEAPWETNKSKENE